MGNRLGSAPTSAACFFSSRPAPPLLPHLGGASSSIPAPWWMKYAELILHNHLTNINSSLPGNLGLMNQNMQLFKRVGPGKKEPQKAAGTSKKADHKNSTVQKSVYWICCCLRIVTISSAKVMAKETRHSCHPVLKFGLYVSTGLSAGCSAPEVLQSCCP